METIYFKRQFRYVDPDKATALANQAIDEKGKWQFNWNEQEIEDCTVDGITEEREYIVSCKATGAVKAVEYSSVEVPTEESEADSFYNGMTGVEKVGMLRYAIENKAKDEISSGLMERHESPEKAQKRKEKKQAEAATKITEWIQAKAAAGEYPSQEAFNEKVREIHAELNLELPEVE